MSTINVRMMREEDAQAIKEIGNQILHTRQRDYWSIKAQSDRARCPVPPYVAEADGRIIGFIMGDANEGEYGMPGLIGWIDAIGVHPEYQRQGVARMLVETMTAFMHKVGVNKVYTLVNWRDAEMLQFFDKLGFAPGDMINLELKV